eukprot:7387823-Pyramimonas_sp.AAC.1
MYRLVHVAACMQTIIRTRARVITPSHTPTSNNATTQPQQHDHGAPAVTLTGSSRQSWGHRLTTILESQMGAPPENIPALSASDCSVMRICPCFLRLIGPP